MKKMYKLNMLVVEITRRCNMGCLHCLRGDSQQVTITKELIDRIFQDIKDVQHIGFTGGEVLLEIDMIEYFVQKLIASHWTTKLLEITTNGTIYDGRLIPIMEEFCRKKSGSKVLLRISNDQFHDKANSEQAYTYYKQQADAVNADMKNNVERILVKYTGDIQKLIYEGRAIELIDSGNSGFSLGENVSYTHRFTHRIKIVGETIPCTLYISANGNIACFEEMSYENMDALSFGNIKNKHISDLIDKHNENCMLLCSESDVLWITQRDRYYVGDIARMQGYYIFHGMVCKQILNLRYLARELYPSIPTQEIITSLPFPNNFEMLKLAIDIYTRCPYYHENVIKSLLKCYTQEKSAAYMDAICRAVLMYLKDKSVHRKYPYELFGEETDIVEELEQKFSVMEDQYKGKQNSNDMIFICDPVETLDIDYRDILTTNGYTNKAYEKKITQLYIDKINTQDWENMP